MAASSSTLTVIPFSVASRRILLANTDGTKLPPGSFTKSRARATPPAMATPASTPARTPPAVLPTSATLARESFDAASDPVL